MTLKELLYVIHENQQIVVYKDNKLIFENSYSCLLNHKSLIDNLDKRVLEVGIDYDKILIKINGFKDTIKGEQQIKQIGLQMKSIG